MMGGGGGGGRGVGVGGVGEKESFRWMMTIIWFGGKNMKDTHKRRRQQSSTPLRQSALQLIKGTVEMHFMGQSDKN